MEVNFVRNDIIHTLNCLDQWALPQRVKKTLVTLADDCFIQSEPYGLVLIIGAWNYPIQLTLLPLVGAIAAGMMLHLLTRAGLGFRRRKPVFATDSGVIVINPVFDTYRRRKCLKV